VAAELDLVGGQELLRSHVVQLVPFELEEEQRCLDLRAQLLHLLQ
jgi:hypothetical protein